jgi:putative transposase
VVNYRRSFFPGGTYFFTVALRDRGADYLIRDIHLLREVFRSVRRAHPFQFDAIVLLPDHLHCIWTLPEGDSNYPNRWRLIKGGFSRALAKTGRPIRRNSKGEYDVWQRRYWEHLVRDERDFQTHMDYIHYNPVKHGFVKRVCDWPYSSFQRFVRQGWISNDWAGNASVGDKSMGE